MRQSLTLLENKIERFNPIRVLFPSRFSMNARVRRDGGDDTLQKGSRRLFCETFNVEGHLSAEKNGLNSLTSAEY